MLALQVPVTVKALKAGGLLGGKVFAMNITLQSVRAAPTLVHQLPISCWQSRDGNDISIQYHGCNQCGTDQRFIQFKETIACEAFQGLAEYRQWRFSVFEDNCA